TTISSTTAATLGTSSSISPGASCPSDCANGRTGSDQWELVLPCKTQPVSIEITACIAMEEDDNDTPRGLFGHALSSIGGLARQRAQSFVAGVKARADGRGASGARSRLRRPSF